jgi:hypothetical protein
VKLGGKRYQATTQVKVLSPENVTTPKSDKQARKGLAGMIGFVHPKSTIGVLIELAQKV